MKSKKFHRGFLLAAIKSAPAAAKIGMTAAERIVAKKPKGIKKAMNIRRGDIYYADLSPVVGSEQGGLRPVLIIQNDVGNRYSPTVIAAAITSRLGKTKLPTHIGIYASEVGLSRDSVILLEQVRTLDKRRLREKIGHLDEHQMRDVNTAISVSFGLGSPDEDAARRDRLRRNETIG